MRRLIIALMLAVVLTLAVALPASAADNAVTVSNGTVSNCFIVNHHAGGGINTAAGNVGGPTSVTMTVVHGGSCP